MQCELGIDLEKVQTEFSSFDVVDHWFSAAEKAEFLALPLHLRNLAFYLGWTRKEAYLKARGEGLHMKLEDFDVSMDPARPALLNSEDATRWKMRSFCPDPEFVATLVAEGAHCELRCREWSLAPNV
jgi:4'-phosphopantetheinyl transferase